MAQVVARVKERVDLSLIQVRAYPRIAFQEGGEVRVHLPRRSGVFLHNGVGILPRESVVDERQEHRLAKDETASLLDIPCHILGVDAEIRHDAGE